jgi:tetratricopeptide (TPR) repeat protein
MRGDVTNPRSESDPLRLDELLAVLPASDDVRPLVADLLASSRPDPGRRWTGSGELGTAGARLVDAAGFEERARAWARREAARLEARVGRVARLAIALGRGDEDSVLDALLAEADALEAEGRSSEAWEWADAASRFARGSGSARAPEALRRAARCARASARLDASVRLYEEAWERAHDLERWTDAVVAATGRGNVAVDRGRWDEADAWYERALLILDATDPPLVEPAAAAPLRWRLFQNLGITHRERGQLERAERWYLMAEQAASGSGDPAATVEIENGRGQLALAQGAGKRAEKHFRISLEALGAPHPDPVRVAVRVNLGEALLLQGRALEAGSVAREAEAEAIAGRHPSRLPEVYRLLARVARARGEAEASVFVQRALEIVRSERLPPFEEALTLRAYAELREGEGGYEAAREARERAREILHELGVVEPEGKPNTTGDKR